MEKKIALVFGTRPEIIKLSALMRLIRQKNVPSFFIHTGQHYSYNMSSEFLRELELPEPDANLEIGSASHSHQTAEMMMKLEAIFEREKPSIVVAQGDTNSVLAAALAALKMNIPFAHLEAGLRSFDRSMPEEVNRIVADQIANFNFVPTKTALKNLEKSESPKESVFFVGNTIVEVTKANLAIAGKKSNVLERLGLEKEKFVFMTAHRQEVVDKKEQLQGILEGIKNIPLKIVWSMHPRTKKNLEDFKLVDFAKGIKNLLIVEPLPYLDSLKLGANSAFIITDSGGIQEEASIYKKPVLVCRQNTERPEILGKFATLVGWDAKKIGAESKKILANYQKMKKKLEATECPFGDGKASERILKILTAGSE